MPFTVKNIQLTPEEEKKIKKKISNDRYNNKKRIATLEKQGYVVLPRELWDTIMKDNDESYFFEKRMKRIRISIAFILGVCLILCGLFCSHCS